VRGKGVFVAQDAASAEDFIHRVMDGNEVGSGGKRCCLRKGLRDKSCLLLWLPMASAMPTSADSRSQAGF